MSVDALDIGPPAGESEVREFADIVFQSFNGFGKPPSRIDQWFEHVGVSNLRLARSGGRVAAGLGLMGFGQYFGGRSVSSMGITAVAVAPADRGRGIGAAMMRRVLLEVAAEGYALSVLYPSTWTLYRAAGYEPAGHTISYRFDLKNLGVRDTRGALRPVALADADALNTLHAARAGGGAGNVDRTPREWRRLFREFEERVYAYGVSAEESGPLEGYVILNQSSPPGRGVFELKLRDFVAATPTAARRLLGFFGQHSTMATHVCYEAGPASAPMMLAREGFAEVVGWSRWMVRVLDAPQAIAQRGFAPGVRVDASIELHDDLLKRNHGRFTLHVADGHGELRPGGAGRVRADIRGLAPLYTGYLSAEELQTTGLLAGPAEELAALSAAFAGPAPWMNDRF
ncbi:MAG: enhanced intracellular survival protein Eis [Phycisphaerae bacterium]